jgi:Xaa-Pro aminopeptidase
MMDYDVLECLIQMFLGNVCFGESSIYSSYFNGPGGNYGMSPAVPLIGSRYRRLQKGDLVFVDIGCAVEGYNTDKTTTYMFDSSIPNYAKDIHDKGWRYKMKLQQC